MTDAVRDLNQQVQGTLDDFAADLWAVNLGPLIVSLERSVEKLHAKIFEDDLSPSGNFWPELAPSTVAAKGHTIILEDLGDLLQSLTTGGTGAAIRERHTTPGAAMLLFGTRDEKSPYHMTGTKKMPKREHVGLNDIFVDEMAGDVADYVLESLREV